MRPVFSRTEGLAFRSSTNADYVYFASIDGDKVVRFVLEKYNVNEMLYSVNGAYYAKVGEAYKVVWEQVMPTGSDGALPAAQVLANVNTQEKADAQIDMILARKAEGVQQAIVGTFEFTVNFVGRATPLVGTAMAFAQDGAKEGFISLAGDVAFFATLGASKVATVSATAARNLRITAAGAQGVIGVARSGQAYFAIKAGNYVQAGGYMGEALLRFIGVKKGIVDELKAIQPLRSAHIPFGFVTREEFANFGAKLSSILRRAGIDDAKAFLQGSAVTGVRRYAKPGVPAGTPFDVIKKSDFDIAIVSAQLFEKAKAMNIPIRQGSRTAPLIPPNFRQLGLEDLRTDLLGTIYKHDGRKLNFVIFDSAEAALSRGASIEVPGL